MTVIETPRLLLRPHRQADAERLVRGLNNFRVSRWTARVPYPYALSDAEAFLALPETHAVRRAIVPKNDPALLMGGISYEGEPGEPPEIGYWIAEPFWGQGYASEAARAMVAHAFEIGGHQSMVASYHIGNEASRRILEGLGFVELGEDRSFSRAQESDTRIMRLRLEQKGRRT